MKYERILIAEDVIRAGERIHVPESMLIASSDIITQGFSIVAIVTGLIGFALVAAILSKRDWLFGAGSLLITAAFIAAVFVSNDETDKERTAYEQDVYDWKQEKAYPYIATLTYSDYLLASIQVANHDRREFTITHQDRSGETVMRDMPDGSHHVYQIHTNLVPGETPFVRVYDLHKDLGHGVDAGEYPIEVFKSLAP